MTRKELSEQIADMILDGAGSIDFERDDIDPDDPEDVWEASADNIHNILKAHGFKRRTNEYEQMIKMVHDSFIEQF